MICKVRFGILLPGKKVSFYLNLNDLSHLRDFPNPVFNYQFHQLLG